MNVGDLKGTPWQSWCQTDWVDDVLMQVVPQEE
jgi:hypothetical protein